ncbi:hypothetical protein FF38_08481 [Lucilia cuprina]|uniref:Uncharacterized protein n=1 Tax=Lucilia cuprina TaxID=7375 RepID=A0A0L0CE00_LUCCU|nr:hypothetical protein FF38_08481 [Lucilia cuprina]
MTFGYVGQQLNQSRKGSLGRFPLPQAAGAKPTVAAPADDNAEEDDAKAAKIREERVAACAVRNPRTPP